ncbi:MAG: CRISPR-associated endonuclease Cas1 [Actinobacteria bacterium]|nr:CRISPR-associated endonuclease Cas1 [Actinomycetota bacterium]
MDLVIDSFGASLRRKSNCFLVRRGDDEEEICADDVTQIILSLGTHISTDAIALAADKNVDIVCLSRGGKPVSRIWPCKFGGTALTRRKQMEALYTSKGVKVAEAMIKAKGLNQAYFLKALNKEREIASVEEAAEVILKRVKSASWDAENIELVRNDMFALEGGCSRLYIQALTSIIPEEYGFFGREKRPPKDPVNAALSYGYAVLYGKVERACILAGLDPFLGYLHTDRFGKPSMSLDLMEPFRQPLVDRVVVTLFVKRSFKHSDFMPYAESEGLYLNETGRKKLLEKLYERFDKEIQHKGRKRKFQDIILVCIRDVAAFLLDDAKKVDGFIYKWN